VSGTLLLRLAGPLQSWGTQSRFEVRDTGSEPSKSGVIGLLCAALGRPREQTVDDLAALRLGVRVDFEGRQERDYHTAGGTHRLGDPYGVALVTGGVGVAPPSRRYYLADADFLVGLEGEDESLLAELARAVEEPRWQLCLGRKAFAPGVPVYVPDGLLAGVALETALQSYPWPRPGLPAPASERRPDRLRLVLETAWGIGEDVRRDQPVGAAFLDRRFALRSVTTRFRKLGSEVPLREDRKE
jgi:CRISPR system Cascade subunit CasD